MRRALLGPPLLALALLMPGGATAQAPARASLPDIEDEVMCLECGTALNVSTSEVANQEREFIAGLIAQGKTKAEIKAALAAVDRFGLKFPNLRDRDGSFVRAWGQTGYPENYVIDREGRVAAVRRFPVTQKWLDETLPPLLDEPA